MKCGDLADMDFEGTKYARRVRRSIVIVLQERQVSIEILLRVLKTASNHFRNGFDDVLTLSVGLLVTGRRQGKFNAMHLHRGGPERRDKFRISVRDDPLRESLVGHIML